MYLLHQPFGLLEYLKSVHFILHDMWAAVPICDCTSHYEHELLQLTTQEGVATFSTETFKKENCLSLPRANLSLSA